MTFLTVHPTGGHWGLRWESALKVIPHDLLLPVVTSLCKLLLLSVGWTGDSLLAKTIGQRGWHVTSGIRSLETDFRDTWTLPLSSLTCLIVRTQLPWWELRGWSDVPQIWQGGGTASTQQPVKSCGLWSTASKDVGPANNHGRELARDASPWALGDGRDCCQRGYLLGRPGSSESCPLETVR